MHRNASDRAAAVVAAVGGEGVRRLLDVGGGSGAYSIAFARAYPELRAEVFDLATVTPIARRHIAAAGVEDRVTTRVGDLRAGGLGQGYDLVFVSAICHMLSPAENQDLLKRCFEALAPGGRAVVQDFVLDASKTAPKNGALFALNMLVGTKAGASYSEPEYSEWLETAGFRPVRCVRMPGPTALMVGAKGV
jgi:predicted O-methyltransferase YrrM